MEMRQKVAPRRLEARRSGLVAGMSALALFCLPADVAAQSTRVTPTLDTALTWTDNAGIDRDGGRDWLFEVSPGLSVSRSAGRLNGSLSARLRNLVHSAGSEDDSSLYFLRWKGGLRGGGGPAVSRFQRWHHP